MPSRRHGFAGIQLSSSSAYLERQDEVPTWLDRLANALLAHAWRPFIDVVWPQARRLSRLAQLVMDHGQVWHAVTDETLHEQVKWLQRRSRREEPSENLNMQSLALVCEVAYRTLGLRPHAVQVMGAWSLLNGRLAEMATGEGKTLTAALAVGTAALMGEPVHVVTVNDYLAERDARIMTPLYAFLGLSVGVVVNSNSSDERRLAYACDVTYCTNKELAFDYLKDKVALMKAGGRAQMALDSLGQGKATAPLLLRGLHFAIIDEADSIFIDEARTPLILSASVTDQEAQRAVTWALERARSLIEGIDFVVSPNERQVQLAPTGEEKVLEHEHDHDGIWRSKRARLELVQQALCALRLYVRDQHYVVMDDKVQIVDEFTGRVLADRSWENGLHQMIEAKESCTLSERRVTIARITYQRLFRRYVRLAGMTGTASEVSGEIWLTYGLRSVVVPLRRPTLRQHGRGRLALTTDEKWQVVLARIKAVAVEMRRPVLVGTRSVEASEQLSARLAEAGIQHVLLNAKQDKDEAQAIAAAGALGSVTVATNMAGRGTDIKLGEGVAERGGLHVILTECHSSGRIDRQLVGRGARQGDPGSCETIASLDDEILVMHASNWLRAARWALLICGRSPWSQHACLGVLRWVAQRRSQRLDARARRLTTKIDRDLETLLAFAGAPE